MSKSASVTGMLRPASRELPSPADRPSSGTPPPAADKGFTRKTAGDDKDANFARSFYRAQNLYQQFRRTFDPGHNVAPGESRSTFYMPRHELPPLEPSRYQAAVSRAIETNAVGRYQLPATSGSDPIVRL